MTPAGTPERPGDDPAREVDARRSEAEPCGRRSRPATAGVVPPQGGHRRPPARPGQLALADTGLVALGRERPSQTVRAQPVERDAGVLGGSTEDEPDR